MQQHRIVKEFVQKKN